MTAPAIPAAFPNTGNPTWGQEPEYGMSLRDWFAGQGIASLNTGELQGWSYQDMANHAYSIADAMLAARGEA